MTQNHMTTTKAPTLSYLNRYRSKPEFAISRDIWSGITKRDFSTREKSLEQIGLLNEKMGQVKFQAARMRMKGDIDKCHQLTKMGDAIKHCIRALQAWHRDVHYQPNN